MRHFLLVLIIGCTNAIAAPISTVDFVRVKDNHFEEAVFYYENNWKRHREAALEKGFILSYTLLINIEQDDEMAILLITEYKDRNQYEEREENFEIVMAVTQKDGRKLLNGLQPAEFRDVFASKRFFSE